MTAPARWSDREEDEPVLDWMLRLQISQAAAETGGGLVPTDRNVPSWWITFRHEVPPPAGLLSSHTATWPGPGRTAS
jgi:hypothetical protein